ncbi:MAG: hypothetical protein JSS24_01315 [Proteobacteria bacterium]|nr:hypothetical protein [Pseudomonadota bacterium]
MKSMLAIVPAVTLILAGSAMAQQSVPQSARSTNPRTLGWMQGFPPTADKTIRFTDADYFAFPKLRWTVCHFRELMPSLGVDKGNGGARPLPVAPMPACVTWPAWAS